MRPITHTSAKQLVPIANKPILFYGIEDLVAAGITDIGVIVGETAAEIRAALGDGSAFGATMTYIPQDAPLGLAHCVLIARDFLGDDEFVMYLGDNMLEQGLDEFVDQFVSSRRAADEPEVGSEPRRPVAQILLAHVDDPTAFGVAEIGPGGDVVSLVEKPADPPSDLALVGVYMFDSLIHDAVAAIEPSERGELEITDAIAWLVDNGHRVEHRVLEGWWIDTGKKDPLLECNRLVLERVEPAMAGTLEGNSRLEGRVVIEEGARIVDSIVRGPAIIGRNTLVESSFIGPFTSVGDGCEVTDSELDHSVVLANSRISGVTRLVDSLIGRNAVVERGPRRPRASRMMLGDHSVVELEG